MNVEYSSEEAYMYSKTNNLQFDSFMGIKCLRFFDYHRCLASSKIELKKHIF